MQLGRWRNLGILALVLLLNSACRAGDWDLVLAQAQGAPAPTTGKVVGGGKNFVVEALVVVALVGASLFAVCRSSRRN